MPPAELLALVPGEEAEARRAPSSIHAAACGLLNHAQSGRATNGYHPTRGVEALRPCR